MENLKDFLCFLVCILMFFIFVFIISSPIIMIEWYRAGKQADIYNKLCKPETPVTQSDMFWQDNPNQVGCNLTIKVKDVK